MKMKFNNQPPMKFLKILIPAFTEMTEEEIKIVEGE